MIKVFSVQNKDKYEIVAVASHQKDLNNLRLMSYELNKGSDKVQLNKDKYGGPYLKFKCDEFRGEDNVYDMESLKKRVDDLQQAYNE